ncbi:oxidoreductase [Aspergillus costaricaensis CBS 115574]|uniref:Oxidoreductase n=1 Tax=Aspergillus costaricaensis CBS 115574 TaxID=1448317 RepID=A0ACD1IUR3_9EURO|nr:oxidoreductase [Aspergillus costaricaensis CBS 115574]RAK93869.1 oxidoreductase [Aspergillus costaricaensis CBS 115574]
MSNPSSLPPFPSSVPTAPLLRLSLSKLQAHDVTETHNLLQACKDIGFFYLDLRDTEEGTNLLNHADKLFPIGERLFDLPLDEKKKYDLASQNSYYGYKAQGAMIADRQGNLDGNEFYNVSKDDILNLTPPLPSPPILQESRPLLSSFIQTSHNIVTLLLSILSTSLSLPSSSTLPNLHRLTSPSGDQIRFIKAPPTTTTTQNPTLGEHTDFGSVTILFNRLGGLQVLPPGADAEWTYVRPLPGHAIINLGDAMVKFTNGLFRSNIHRVVAPPGQQAGFTRYSLVYFARPEDEVPLRRLESDRIPALGEGVVEEEISSKDWVIRRALGRRVDLGRPVDYEKAAGTEGVSRRLGV